MGKQWKMGNNTRLWLHSATHNEKQILNAKTEKTTKDWWNREKVKISQIVWKWSKWKDGKKKQK